MRKEILALFSILFITSHFTAQTPNKVLDGIIAVVGDKIILQSELEAAKESAMADGKFAIDSDGCTVVEDLLFQALLVQQAEKDTLIEVSDQQVDAEMNQKINYFVSQLGGDQNALEKFYGKSIEELRQDFREAIRDRLKADMMRNKIIQDVRITPAEVYDFYESIPKDSVPEVDGQIEIQQVVIQPKLGRDEIEEVKAQLQEWRDQVASGEKSISTIAVLYSEDPGSRSFGGKTGFQPRGTFVPEFEAVAYSLEKGEVSSVFKTEFGYHFMQLVERRGDNVNVAHVLRKPKVKPESQIAAKQKADSIYTLLINDSLTFESAVAKFSDDEKTNKNKGFVQNQYTMSTMFELEMLKQIDQQMYFAVSNISEGSLSKPVLIQSPIDGQSFRIFYVKKKIDKHQANIRDDYQIIEQMAKAKKQQEIIKTWVKNKLFSTHVEVKGIYQDCKFSLPWIK